MLSIMGVVIALIYRGPMSACAKRRQQDERMREEETTRGVPLTDRAIAAEIHPISQPPTTSR